MSTQQRSGLLEPRVFAVVIWLIPLCVVAVGVQGWLPHQASEHSPGIDYMLQYSMISMAAILLAGHFALGYFVWRFGGRAKTSYRLPPPKVERRWSLVPIVVMSIVAEGGVLALGLPVWTKYIGAAPPADSVQIEVTGEQFAWNFRYPGEDGKFGRTHPKLITLDNPLGLDKNDPDAQDDRITLGSLTLPVEQPIHIRLRSKDVLHSFFLPQHRVKQDAVPGMTIDLWFIPTEAGEFEIACTELCGLGHYTMRGVMTVASQQEFDDWLAAETPFVEFL